MTDKELLATGIEDLKTREHIRANIDTIKCFSCGRKADYRIFAAGKQLFINYAQVGYKGVNHIVCTKCFTLNIACNDIIFKLVRLLSKLLS